MAVTWKEVALVDDLAGFAQTNSTDNAIPYGDGSGGFSYTLAPSDKDILVANGSSHPVWVAMSGDATISNAGVVSIANNAVDNDAIADNAVNLAEMAHGTEGDILIYGDSGVPIRLPHGTAGQSLIIDTDGNDNRPKWSSASAAGTVTVNESDADTNHYLCFTASDAGAGATITRDSDMYYNASGNKLTVPAIESTLTGIASQATKVATTEAGTSNTYYPVLSSGSAGASVDLISSSAYMSVTTNATATASTVTIAGNLIVNGETTTVSTASLEIEDKTIKVAINATTPGTGAAAGMVVDAGSATETHNPRIIWTDNANASSTTATTTGWAISNHGADATGAITANAPTADSVLHNIAVMKLGTADSAIGTLDVGLGAMAWTTDGSLYIQSATDQ